MAFNPASPLAFNFTQYQANIQEETVTLDVNNAISNVNSIQVLNLPPWLVADNISYEGNQDKIYFRLRVNASYAFAMAEGDYNGTIRIKYNGTLLFQSSITSDPYNVSLSVVHVTPLSLSPTTLPFNFLVGEQNPQNQTLNITSESNWTINPSQNWVTLSQNTGVNSGQVFVGVDPTGLTVGQYSAILTVQDAQGIRQANVTLNVNEGDTDIDFLYISPQNLQFLSQLAVANTTINAVSVEASGNWTAVSSDSWLVISATSGSSGISSIDVSVDSAALINVDDPYLGQITFTQQNLQKIIYVELFLVEFFIQGITSETLYFSDDRNKLQVTNILPNMFLYLEGTLNNGVQNQLYKLNAPYQNGLAKVLFGLETNVMLRSVVPTNNFSSRIKNNISPVTINFVAYNKQLNTGAAIPIDNYSNVRFLTGKTPTVTNKLCNVPSTIHVTKNAVLSLSCLSTELLNEIVITGDVTATLTTGIADNLLVYNAIVNLSALDLAVGNAITITFGVMVVNIVIKEENIEHTILAFENEWKEYENFECTGKLQIDTTADVTETKIQVEGDTQTKVVSIDSGKTYTVNTGPIYSQAEIEWLAKILEAKRKFIYINGEPVEIVITTKSLNTYETRKAFNSYKLKFKKAIV